MKQERSKRMIVHALHAGLPLCGFFKEMPKRLPKGHRFVSAAVAVVDVKVRRRITCSICNNGVRQLRMKDIQKRLLERKYSMWL